MEWPSINASKCLIIWVRRYELLLGQWLVTKKMVKAVEDDQPILERVRTRVQIKNPLFRELLAEFGSTLALVFFGLSNVAQFVLTKETVNAWVQVNIGWGFAIAFCAYTAARTSGAHMNPAISMLFFSFGQLPLKKLLLYSLVQTVGAFFGAAAMYLFYLPLFDAYDGGNRTVAGEHGSGMVFCSYPGKHLGVMGPYIVGTAVLAFLVCIVIDQRNEIPNFLHPLFIGFGVMMIGTMFAVNLGYPINPARDFAPRLFSSFIYGSDAFLHPYPLYFLAPIIGPMIGAPLGGWLYHLLFGFHIPESTSTVYRIVHNNEVVHHSA